jgi:hypothetical protein
MAFLDAVGNLFNKTVTQPVQQKAMSVLDQIGYNPFRPQVWQMDFRDPKRIAQESQSQLPPQYQALIHPSPTPSPKPMLDRVASPGPAISPIPDDFRAIADPIFQKYGIPPAVGYGQFGAEGRLKGLGASRNNPYNLGAYDSSIGSAFSYPSLEKGVEAYAKLLSGKYELGHIGSGRFDKRYIPAYEVRNDPRAMIEAIARIGYASNPNYAKLIFNTPEFQYYLNGGNQ